MTTKTISTITLAGYSSCHSSFHVHIYNACNMKTLQTVSSFNIKFEDTYAKYKQGCFHAKK